MSKKKCVRALVVAVLEHLDQREAEQAVVELDGALDVAADVRGVVHAAGGRRRAFARGLRYCSVSSGAPCGQCCRVVRCLLRGPYQQFSTFWAGCEHQRAGIGEADRVAGAESPTLVQRAAADARRTRARAARRERRPTRPGCRRPPHSTASCWWMVIAPSWPWPLAMRHQPAGGERVVEVALLVAGLDAVRCRAAPTSARSARARRRWRSSRCGGCRCRRSSAGRGRGRARRGCPRCRWCSRRPESTQVTISMSRWPWVPKPWPGATTSSLLTSSRPWPSCVGRVVRAEVERVAGVQPAGVGEEAVVGSLDGDRAHDLSNIVAAQLFR